MRGISITISDPICPSRIAINGHRLFPVSIMTGISAARSARRGAKVEDRLAAMDVQQIDTAVMFPTSGLGVGRVREPQFQTALCRAYNDFISDYCKASPRLKAVANLPVNNPSRSGQGTEPGSNQARTVRRNARRPSAQKKSWQSGVLSAIRRSAEVEHADHRSMLSAATSRAARYSINLSACIRRGIPSQFFGS